MPKRIAAFFVFFLILTNLILYWPHSGLGYVLDDHYVVSQNPVIKKPSLEGIVTSGFFDAANRSLDSQLQYYRPVVLASFAKDYWLWGANPSAFRWVNVGIHICNSLLVAVLFYWLFVNGSWAMAGAFLFSILPVQEWSVRYITGRGDLLSAFFGLSCLVLLIQFLKRESKGFLWGSLLCFVCALLSKESSLLHVALVCVVTWTMTKDWRRTGRVASFFLLAAVSYYGMRQMFGPISLAEPMNVDQILKGLIVSLEYGQRFLIPWSVQSWMAGASSLGLLVKGMIGAGIGLGIIFCVEHRRGVNAVVFALAWMVIGSAAFLVTQRIIGRLGPVLSEHFLYMESVGFVLLIVVLISQLSRPLLRVMFLASLSVYFIVVSLISARHWTSEESLLRYVHHLEERHEGVAYEQLIMRYVPDEAAVLRMIKNAPSGDTQSIWYRRLGDIYRSQGHYPQAREALARAVDLSPRNIEAINELAVCHLETGAIPQGVKLLEGSILISPGQSDAFRLMGILNYRLGRFTQAVPFLQRAGDRDPDESEAALHLMMAYFFIDDQRSYLQAVDQVSEKFKNTKLVLGFAATELYSHGRFQEALNVILQAEPVFRSDPAMTQLAQSARERISTLPKQ